MNRRLTDILQDMNIQIMGAMQDMELGSITISDKEAIRNNLMDLVYEFGLAIQEEEYDELEHELNEEGENYDEGDQED